MAISKQYLKTKPICKVTFTVPAEDAKEVAVVGDFNDWNPKAKGSKLKKLKNGSFKGTYDLPKDVTYEFKYIVDGNYVNEPEADGFQWNDFAGADNAIIIL